MTEDFRDTFIAKIEADLTFEVVRERDGTLRVNGGWFDSRSGKHGMTFVLVSIPSLEPVGDDQDLVDKVYELIPGKGRLDVR